MKVTKTKTITTERYPADKPDMDTDIVSQETIRIDDYTEDEITKTTKILAGMQYDITTTVRSVSSAPIGMAGATGGKTWSSDSPSPRNMPTNSAPPESKPLEYKPVAPPAVPGAPAPAPAPTQKVATFKNLGTDPSMAQAELYYENTPFGPLGHGDPPLTVETYPGHRWFIVANGTYAKLFTIGEGAEQSFTF